MQNFPYLTDYVNATFEKEKARWDYIFLRPILLVVTFLIRLVLVPFKFVFHRKAWGFEEKVIDSVIAFGIKHLATHDALKLLIRHVQIEPLLYRYILSGTPERKAGTGEKLKGIDGDFSVDSVEDVVAHGLTICHDDLSYEVMKRFDKDAFLNNLEFYRNSAPEDIEQFGTKVLEQNREHSLQLFGCTNVVIFIVATISVFADYNTVLRALNSFDSDSVLLWGLKNICANDQQAMVDLDFYIQEGSKGSHYNSSPFFADPNQYLFDHIAFDEFAYELLSKQNTKS